MLLWRLPEETDCSRGPLLAFSVPGTGRAPVCSKPVGLGETLGQLSRPGPCACPSPAPSSDNRTPLAFLSGLRSGTQPRAPQGRDCLARRWSGMALLLVIPAGQAHTLARPPGWDDNLNGWKEQSLSPLKAMWRAGDQCSAVGFFVGRAHRERTWARATLVQARCVIRFQLLQHGTSDGAVYKEKGLFWLTVLEAGKWESMMGPSGRGLFCSSHCRNAEGEGGRSQGDT